LIISVDSDVCFYPEEQVEFENLLKENDIKTTLKVINSIKGHDCFLLEPELFKKEFQNFI
jgi:homoserine O-acetyltransferase